ncbi:transcription factor [Fusarium tjaetaba]|uniref:Transcription factor n=1 Tax=Fusarium tjaetaba TaxID=1567544 RepID=A0A8H5S1E1_9HYPO|nr:transcription factor [Fusarium tjaetaba]KAF5645070.1 transcription factor [Fusarium tjaetaba]
MNSEESFDTLLDFSMCEMESQDLQGQSTPNVEIIDDDDNTAPNLCIDNAPIRLPLFQQETFTNPLMYSDEETTNALLRIIEQDRDDAQANGTIQPENPVTEAPAPTSEAPTIQNRQQTKSPTENASVPQSSPAPSAAPNVKAVPQAETRGVKRAREPEPAPPKRPTARNGRGAAKTVKPEEAKRPRCRLKPKIDDQLNRNVHLAQARMGFNPPVTPCPHCGNMTWSYPGPSVESWGAIPTNTPMDGGAFMGQPATRRMEFGPVLPQQQDLMGMNPHSIPTPHNGNMAFSSHLLPPPQQTHDEMALGSMRQHNQAVDSGIPTVSQNILPNYSHLQPRVNGNAMKMH